MAWVESSSKHFKARHNSQETAGALAVLAQLEQARERLNPLFPESPGGITVVLHPAGQLLWLAHPQLLLLRQLTAREARRYLTGWFTSNELHLLAPRALRGRAGSDASERALELAPTYQYARLLVGVNNGWLPPPFNPATVLRLWRTNWLLEGAAQHLSGQVEHLSAAIRLRLRSGIEPQLPLAAKDVPLFAGTLFELLQKERGMNACLELCSTQPIGAGAMLENAFDMDLTQITKLWQAYMAELIQAASY